MRTPLLATKFHIRSVPQGVVERPGLMNRLTAGLSHKLTLLSAPAGFGKSTTACQWVHLLIGSGATAGAGSGVKNESQGQEPTRVGWLSLETADNDLLRFITYLIGALRSALTGAEAATLGEESLQLMNQALSPDLVLTPLVNQVAELGDTLILVLDDYHLIENGDIHDTIGFLIEHMGPSFHLVISTRQDPPLPLARMRARDELTEVRAVDLRFSRDTVSEFLGNTLGLELSDTQVATVERKTEGWAAGLRLTGASLQGARDVSAAISSIAGSNRHIADYLLDEVLHQQGSEIQRFLLQTSLLDRFTGPLCDAVTTGSDGQQIIEMLENSNLFVIPLDDSREWYRYHHLFSELLSTRLLQTSPELIPELNLRASRWFEKANMQPESIRHAFAAGEMERVADLAELAWPDWNDGPVSLTWFAWVADLPREVVRDRPNLSAAFAFANLNAGNLEEADARLCDAERWSDPPGNEGAQPGDPPAAMIVVDDDQYRALPAWLASLRSYHAQATGDYAAAAEHIRRSLDLYPPDDQVNRASATALLGLTYWADGNIKAAERVFPEQLFTSVADRVQGAFVLAEMKSTLGYLHDAARICEDTFDLASQLDDPFPRGLEDAHTALGEIHREMGDLAAADHHLRRAHELGEKNDLPDWKYRWCVARARLEESRGNFESALVQLAEAERAFVRTPLPVVRPIATEVARIWVRLGRLQEARAWARERALSAKDEISFLSELDHMTLARILIAGHPEEEGRSLQDAMNLLDRLLAAAVDGERTRSAISVQVLESLGHRALGDLDQAVAVLGRAMKLAEPEDFVSVFVDEGTAISSLVHRAATEGIVPGFAQRLLTVFIARGSEPATDSRPATDGPHAGGAAGQMEPLSKRELEVLGLIGEGLTNEEVGARLFISTHTVKAHTRTIYTKLEAHSRTEALVKAKAFGFLS